MLIWKNYIIYLLWKKHSIWGKLKHTGMPTFKEKPLNYSANKNSQRRFSHALKLDTHHEKERNNQMSFQRMYRWRFRRHTHLHCLHSQVAPPRMPKQRNCYCISEFLEYFNTPNSNQENVISFHNAEKKRVCLKWNYKKVRCTISQVPADEK